MTVKYIFQDGCLLLSDNFKCFLFLSLNDLAKNIWMTANLNIVFHNSYPQPKLKHAFKAILKHEFFFEIW